MRRSSRGFRLLGVAGLLISLLSVLVAPASAQQDSPDGPTMDWDFDNVPRSFVAGPNAIYYPWVANDDDFGLGAADTSISVQNLEDRDGQIWIYRGNGDNSWSLATTAALSAYASKTFTAGQLGIASGAGAPVAVVGFSWIAVPGDELPWGGIPASTTTYVETVVVLNNPLPGAGNLGQAQVVACVANNAAGNPSPFRWMYLEDGYEDILDDVFGPDGWTTDGEGNVWVLAPWTQTQLQDALDAVNEDNDGALINPFGGLNGDGDCNDALGVSGETVSLSDGMAIGGVAKMAAAGNTLPMTTSADTAVSGYNAINGLEVDRFNEWYLPIVQTNCGPGGCWNSIIRVANLADHNSSMEVRFFPADDGSGSLQTGFQIQLFLNGGETGHINLGDYVPEGWVGSAHIYSDGWTFAMVDRYKVGYDMWLTNTGSASEFEQAAQWETQLTAPNGAQYALFAPSVMSDWFGWNTGINVANLVNADNNVSIQYFNLFGNATQGQSKRLAPHGMTYFYDPSDLGQNISTQDPASDPNPGVVGSAIIWSDAPVAAAVDATKYPETSPGTSTDWFQATSYNATQNIYTFQAVPLVQKGNPASGMGATSGINILNPNATAAQANVYWVNPSGFNASNFGVSTITIPAYSNGFVYTMFHHNLPNGFVGAAQVISNVPVAAVSANVDYQVDGDGSVIFNAFNHCGFYRTSDPGMFPPEPQSAQLQQRESTWQCFFGDPLDTTGRTVTKTFVNEWNQPVSGVNFHIVNDNPDFDPARYATSDVNGFALFSNVPVGNYELVIDSVPTGYLMPENPADEFTLLTGQDVNLENELFFAQAIEKSVVVAGTEDEDSIALAGVDVTVHFNIAADPETDTPLLGAAVPGGVGQTDANGEFSLAMPPGYYILCIWDDDEAATTVPGGETVVPDLPDTAPPAYDAATCDAFELEAGPDEGPVAVHELVNPIEVAEGIFNGFVYAEEEDNGDNGAGNSNRMLAAIPEDDGLEGAEVCLFEAGADIEVDTPLECTETDELGLFTFASLEPGAYILTVQLDGYAVELVLDGGSMSVTSVDESEDGLSSTPAVIEFEYDPTADLGGDGWLDDVAGDNTIRGNFDIEIEMVESTLRLIEKTVTLDSDPVAAQVLLEREDPLDDPIVNAGPVATPNPNPPYPLNTVEVVTAAEETAWFYVDATGEYLLCSSVEVVLNPDANVEDQETVTDTLCEDVLIEDGDFESQSFENNHQTTTLVKTVQEQVCIEQDEVPDCTEPEPVAGADVVVTIGGEDFTFTTGDNGIVTVVVPVNADTVIMVCSTVAGEEICEATDDDEPLVLLPGEETQVTNLHTIDGLGQLDLGWPQGGGTVTTDSNETWEYCLYDSETDFKADGFVFGEGAVSECATLPSSTEIVSDDSGPNTGVFFTNVPAGTYVIAFQLNGAFGVFATELAYDPAFDRAIDGISDDIEPGDSGETHGTLQPDAMFDFRLAGVSEPNLGLAYGYVLTVIAPVGVQVEVVAGACVDPQGSPGGGEVTVTGPDGVQFHGMVPNADYCVLAFDTSDNPIGQLDHTYDEDGSLLNLNVANALLGQLDIGLATDSADPDHLPYRVCLVEFGVDTIIGCVHPVGESRPTGFFFENIPSGHYYLVFYGVNETPPAPGQPVSPPVPIYWLPGPNPGVLGASSISYSVALDLSTDGCSVDLEQKVGSEIGVGDPESTCNPTTPRYDLILGGLLSTVIAHGTSQGAASNALP